MKLTVRLVILFCLAIFLSPHSGLAQVFSKADYYRVMASKNINDVEKQLKITSGLTGNAKSAYTGALLMKKAGMIKGPARKLNTFKKGHGQLEDVIQKDKNNAEWRLLRLIIQENAPKILGYNKDIKEDAAFLATNLNNLPPDVQAAVADYKKESDVLK